MLKVIITTDSHDELLRALRLLHPITRKARIRQDEKDGKIKCWITLKE